MAGVLAMVGPTAKAKICPSGCFGAAMAAVGRAIRVGPEAGNGLGHVPLAQWMSAVRSRHRLPPPGRAMRAYQTSCHLPVAVAQAFVLTRPTRGGDTSAPAIFGLILTSRGPHCLPR